MAEIIGVRPRDFFRILGHSKDKNAYFVRDFMRFLVLICTKITFFSHFKIFFGSRLVKHLIV